MRNMITKSSSFLACDMKIIEAKNISSELKGNLFVRYYLPSGIGKKPPIALNTREIPTRNDAVWDESLSLECRGIGIKNLEEQDKFVFELRLRSSVAIFGGSKVLGRAEIPFEKVLNSRKMIFDEWLNMIPTRRHGKEESVAKLKVEIRVRVLEEVIKSRDTFRDICGCRDGQHGQYDCSTCDDYDVFALVAAIEAF